MDDLIKITHLANRGDQRGDSFLVPIESLSFISPVIDIHLATIISGSYRGNHYHKLHREILLLVYTDTWSFHWDGGPKTQTKRETFSGSGTVMIEIEPHAAHAVRNDGVQNLYIFALSNLAFDHDQPDQYERNVL